MTPEKPSLIGSAIAWVAVTANGDITWLERKIIYGAAVLIMALLSIGYANLMTTIRDQRADLANLYKMESDVKERLAKVETLCQDFKDYRMKMEASKK